MKVLVDTSVWSLAFRRKRKAVEQNESKPVLEELKELIDETRAVMIGPVRQEILSGIPGNGQFTQLKEKLRAFDDFPISTRDHELAAEYFNRCRERGVQGAHTDFLILAVANRNDMAIFTTDRDFDNYLRIIKLNLHSPRH